MHDTSKPFYWATPETLDFMSQGYLQGGESVQQRVTTIAHHAESILKGMCLVPEDTSKYDGWAEKFIRYMSRGWYSLATPVWANFGRAGLPISCNQAYTADSIASYSKALAAIMAQTKQGAGTSLYMGALRPRGTPISGGGYADGPAHFAPLVQQAVSTISQRGVRRGACAVYLDIEHPDIQEWLLFRGEGHPIQDLNSGICITDKWLEEMKGGEREKQKLWLEVLKARSETGEPYLFFTDTANRNKPQVYKDLDMKIHASNLCTEVMLPSSEEESFVCCLSSLNLLHWDSWKTQADDVVGTLVELLDAVMEEYIKKTGTIPDMESSQRFALNHRAIGVGVLGWHSYLQSNMVAFNSDEAEIITAEYSKIIRAAADQKTEELAVIFGEPPLLKGYGRRHTTTLAIAPTTSSSFILGAVSPATDPLTSNTFIKRLANGSFYYKNPYLREALADLDMDNKATWLSIQANFGSVQHLDIPQKLKDVFATWEEIPNEASIRQASIRQELMLDQGQSVNLMLAADTPPKELNRLHLMAWELGLKSLYYQRTPTNPVQKLIVELRNQHDCLACEA